MNRFSVVSYQRWSRLLVAHAREFFFAPASARPLALLRIGLAGGLLLQAFLLRGSIFDFFSSQGLLQAALDESSRSSLVPSIGLFTSFASLLHFDESACLLALCWFYTVAVLMFGLGYLYRFSALSVFFLHWILTSPSYGTAYGFDLVTHVFLFYFIFLPAADVWSVDLLLKGESERCRAGSRLGLRFLQIQLCLIFLNSGLVKASHRAWWNGEVLWRSLSLPIYQQYSLNELAYWPKLLMFSGWLVVLIQLGFAMFIWPRSTRKRGVAAIVVLNLNFVWFFGLGLYGALMSLLTIALFGFSAEPPATFHAIRGGSTSWLEPVEPELMLR